MEWLQPGSLFTTLLIIGFPKGISTGNFFLKLIELPDHEKQFVLFTCCSCALFLLFSEEKGNTHRF
jgi:hypothetical protein